MKIHAAKSWTMRLLFIAACANAQAGNIIDPLLDGDDALEALSKMDCGPSSKSSYKVECSYGALTESAAYFDACLPLLEQRHGKTLAPAERERFFSPLSSWTALAPAATRAAVLDKNNNLRRSLASIAKDRLSALDDEALDETCSERISRVARQDEPISLATILWSPAPKSPNDPAPPAPTQEAILLPARLESSDGAPSASPPR